MKEIPFEYKYISTKNILIDSMYQRDLDPAKVNRILKKFDPRLVNPIKVSYRNGRYYVFDGQHTMAAQKARNGNKDLMVHCKVYYGLTWWDEAMLFVEQNGESSKVDINAKFKALFNAGDTDIQNMVRLTEKCGFKVNFKKGQENNKIVALSTLYKIYKSRDNEEFVKCLNIIKAAWNGSKESTSNEVLRGVALFCLTYKGMYNPTSLKRKLSKISPLEIIRDGKLSGAPGDIKFGRKILSIYNTNASTNRLQDLF